VTVVYAPTDQTPDQTPARHEWARELLLIHVARHELDVSPGLMTLPAWRKLTTPDVLDFVVNVGELPKWPPLDSGRTVGYSYRTFGNLTVVVSMVNDSKPRRIRKQFQEGYRAYLEYMLHELDFGRGTADVAHWILCRGRPDNHNAVQLAYAPTSRDAMLILPIDLLTGREKRRGSKAG
jgi:hypothetical protein